MKLLDSGIYRGAGAILGVGLPKVSVNHDLEFGHDIHPQDDLWLCQASYYYKTGARLLGTPCDGQFPGEARDIEGGTVSPEYSSRGGS